MDGITKQDLWDFETDIFDTYSIGKIKAPVHLTGSKGGEQEDALIKIFKKIKKNDWVFSTHRSHYHALLKSQDKDWVKGEIMDGKSSHLNSKKHKIFTSAIVGGCLPIALGTAMGIKLKYENEGLRRYALGKNQKKIPHVWCFIGDMASQMGIFHECLKYAIGHKLPITFIIEDNGLGVYTPTEDVWGSSADYHIKGIVMQYKYKRKYPHYGVGKWITF